MLFRRTLPFETCFSYSYSSTSFFSSSTSFSFSSTSFFSSSSSSFLLVLVIFLFSFFFQVNLKLFSSSGLKCVSCEQNYMWISLGSSVWLVAVRLSIIKDYFLRWITRNRPILAWVTFNCTSYERIKPPKHFFDQNVAIEPQQHIQTTILKNGRFQSCVHSEKH